MGWAKYYEDNLEIMHDRQNTREYSFYSTPVKITVKVAIEPVPVIEEPKYKHRKLVCQDCGRKFRFSRRDQAFFEQNGWADPIRCKECRKNRKSHYLMSA